MSTYKDIFIIFIFNTYLNAYIKQSFEFNSSETYELNEKS